MILTGDTICAISTPAGVGGIAVAVSKWLYRREICQYGNVDRKDKGNIL